jgi:hypothetical protein
LRKLAQTGDGKADDLRHKIETDTELDNLTRTPFVLAEAVSLFEAGIPIREHRSSLEKPFEGALRRPLATAPSLAAGEDHWPIRGRRRGASGAKPHR